jgi:hypothetical protein
VLSRDCTELFSHTLYSHNITATSALSVLASPSDLAAAEAELSNVVAIDGLNNITGTPNEQPNERYKAITLQSLDKVAEKHPELEPHLYDVKLSGMVFPFKASPYFVDELIDGKAENVRDDAAKRVAKVKVSRLV